MFRSLNFFRHFRVDRRTGTIAHKARPDSPGARLRLTTPADPPETVVHTTVPPWCSVCCLEITTRDPTPDGRPLVGTGWLIGPTTVITAAHNLRNREFGPAETITVTPAKKDQFHEGPYTPHSRKLDSDKFWAWDAGWDKVLDAMYKYWAEYLPED